MKKVVKCYTYIDAQNLNNSYLEPDHLLVFEIKIDMAIETLSVMSTVVLGNRHEVVAVRVLQVTGEG